MSDDTAAILFQRIHRTPHKEMCHCAEIDFRDWPTDLPAKCAPCRDLDDIQQFEREAERRVWEKVIRFCEKQAIAHAGSFRVNLILNELAEEFERMSQGKTRKLVLNTERQATASREEEHDEADSGRPGST